MQSHLLILSAAVAAVSATHPLALPKFKRDLEVRQTDFSVAPSCSTAVLDLVSAMPTIPPSIMSAALDGELQSILESPCEVTMASSLSSDYQEYSSEVESWFSSHSSEYSSVLDKCSDLISQLGGTITESAPVCSTTATNSGRTTSGSASRTPSSGTASETSDTTSQTTPTSAASGSSKSGSQTSASASASSTQNAGSAGARTSVSIFAAVAAGVFALAAL